MKCIKYKGGYKYQLKESYELSIPLVPQAPISTEYIKLEVDGKLKIMEGYAWDGPSGPTIDTATFMRGSLVHDALYQLIREGYLKQEDAREIADKILREICLEDGMWSVRAWWVYENVRIFGNPSADPANVRPLQYSPSKCEK